LLAFLGFFAPEKPRKAKLRAGESQGKPRSTLAFIGFSDVGDRRNGVCKAQRFEQPPEAAV
jgi:hypothetical protein